jgi:hypothetical protein
VASRRGALRLEPNLVKFTAGPPFFSAFQSGSITTSTPT